MTSLRGFCKVLNQVPRADGETYFLLNRLNQTVC